MHLFIAFLLQELPKVEVAAHTSQQTTAMLIQQLPAILTSLASLVAVILTGRNLSKGQAVIAVKADEAATKADKAAVVAQATHILVNSDHGIQLRQTAGYTQRIADMSGDAADHEIAKEAKKASDDHEAAQNTVNKTADATVDEVAKIKAEAAPPLTVLKEVLKK